jgi:hypothetical protein
LGNNVSPASEASYYAITSQAYPGDATFNKNLIFTLPLSAAWGEDAPWDEFYTREGWTITSEVTLTPEVVDGLGTVDMKVKDKQVTAVCVPAGITPADVLPKLSFGQGMGAVRPTGDNLVLTSGGALITLSDAVMTDSALAFGDTPFVGETTWVASRTWVEGAEQPLLVLSTD